MNMKYFGVLWLFLACLGALHAQQVPQYSLYTLNPYVYNPAYAGMENTLVMTGVYRQQWTGLQGAPVTQHVNAHLPVYAISSGVGLRLENDAIGAHKTTQAILSYNYQVNLSSNTLLSMGLSGGWLQYSLDGAKLRAPEGTYAEPSFSHNETILPEGRVQAGAPVFEAGLFFQNKKWELGLSAQPVFATKVKPGSNGNFVLSPVQHYLIYGAYYLPIGDNLKLKPSGLVKTDFKETQIEISAMGVWRENTFAGVSYRGFTASSKDAAVLFLGFKMNEKTTLGYGFDLPLSALSVANRGSHELLIRYSLNKPIGVGKLPPVIYNPRFF
ncbi:MAG: type IX secretion system membrane protein PorP/SprF [Chitinophagales bacterium]|nr:type IX secretion system membrane protein PorP/SprF [Chitinophagales bacterium]